MTCTRTQVLKNLAQDPERETLRGCAATPITGCASGTGTGGPRIGTPSTTEAAPRADGAGRPCVGGGG